MKPVERRLLSELLKNSRRSDRELAKVLGVSQPTVSRMIKRLEEQGIIKEYTIVPDFDKLGYAIMGFTFVRMKKNISGKEQDEFREYMSKFTKEHPHAELIAVSGLGLNKDFAFVGLYRDYSAYAATLKLSKEVPYSEVGETEGFLVNLRDKSLTRVLSMSALAKDTLISK
jgi:DNA-binding Lrp family transcriptional regulator